MTDLYHSTGFKLQQGLDQMRASMSETIELESISRLDVKPGETLVLRMPYRLSPQNVAAIEQRVRPHLPDGVRLLVIERDVEPFVVASASEFQPVPDKYRT